MGLQNHAPVLKSFLVASYSPTVRLSNLPFEM